jgi:hypothetical protein
MAGKKKSTAKKKKSEPKSKLIKSTLDAAAEAKVSKGSSDTSDSTDSNDSTDSAADSGPADYSIGEGQKTVTKAYRKGWDSIFSNKR